MSFIPADPIRSALLVSLHDAYRLQVEANERVRELLDAIEEHERDKLEDRIAEAHDNALALRARRLGRVAA